MRAALPLGLGLALWVWAAADADLTQIRTFAPAGDFAELTPANLAVGEWVLGAGRQRDFKPITAQRVLRFGRTHFVQGRGSSRWLVGYIHDPKSGRIECDQQFKSLADLAQAAQFPPVPTPPTGWTLRELCRLPHHPTRITGAGTGQRLYVLCINGDVWRVELPSGALTQILHGHDYIDPTLGERSTYGAVLDKAGQLYIVCNQRIDSARPIRNDVTIFRTTAHTAAGDPSAPKPWLRTSYPWGIGPFNHGVGHIAFGPDGHLYVCSGSRTDGNERGKDARYSAEGETPLTACIWRLDPRVPDQPTIEIYARGLRNAYAFAWTERGELYACDNGPDADPPEELNHIRPGRHYGFPYRFSDWPNKPYPHTPDAPAGWEFQPPVRNLGPDAGGRPDQPIGTFDAHSCPLGLAWLDASFPPNYRGSFVVARFGNLLHRKRDVGFDVLTARLTEQGQAIECRTLLAGVARPIDVHVSGAGKLYVCEYSRQITNTGYGGMLPGRILELTAPQ
jgi:hypothetical protein